MASIEKLDLKNVFEIQEIKKILSDRPDLLTIFESVIRVGNARLNTECKNSQVEIFIEEYIEPDLSSDSDEEITD
jgi:hypothetical protein